MHMGSGRADRVSRARAKSTELRRTAASRGSELGRTAATRSAELGRTAASRGADIGRNMRNLDVPWARCAPARWVRETILQFVLAPLMDVYLRPRVAGRA